MRIQFLGGLAREGRIASAFVRSVVVTVIVLAEKQLSASTDAVQEIAHRGVDLPGTVDSASSGVVMMRLRDEDRAVDALF